MLYEFECPKCGQIKTVEAKLAELKKLSVTCDNKDCVQCNMRRVLSGFPKHTSWGEWNK